MTCWLIGALITLLTFAAPLPATAFADEAPAYTVSFDAGEGTGTKEPVTGVSGEYTLPWITTTSFAAPEGTEFKGWEINGTIYAENATINVTSDITAKAIWVIPTSIQLQSIDFYSSKAVGYQLDQKITRYWKNGDSSQFTGTPDDYNAKIEWSVRDGKDVATITLKGANTADTDNTNYGLTVLAANTFDVDIVVEEDSVMDQFSLYSCDVSISGDGKLTIVDPKVDAQNIYVDGNLTLNGANIYAESLEKNAANIIFATGNLVIDNSTVEIKSGSDWTASAYPNYNFAPLRSNGTMTISNGSDVKVTCIDGTTCHAVMSMEDITIEDSTVTVANNGTNRGISSEKDIYIKQTANGTTNVTVKSNGIAIAARSGKLTISGGTVTATPATTYAALRADEIVISGGNVTANAVGTYGIQAEAGNITISGDADVKAISSTGAAMYATGNVSISEDASIKAESGSNTGIVAEGNLTISGTADVKANGKWALWSKANNIAISGGTVEAIGSSYALVSKPVLTGYANPVVFAGADTSSAAIIVDTANTAYHGMKYVKVQAGYIITFDANGGTVTGASAFATDVAGKLLAMPADPTNGDYTFAGWFDAQVGGNPVPESVVFAESKTVYAHWYRIDSVVVFPAAADVDKGATKAFSATVSGSGEGYGSAVTWSVSGNTSDDTGIDGNGLLTVGADEQASTITVTAASASDSAKLGTATVTVKAPYVPPYTPPVVEVTVPISGDENTIHVGAAVSGDKAVIDEVDLSHLDTVIGEHVDTGTVTIDFSGLDSSTPVTTVEIPSDAIKQIAEAVNDPANDARSLEVILSDGTSIEFDAEALGEKAAQADGLDITISIEHHDDAALTDEQVAAVGDRPALDINVTSGGEHISDMGGKVSVHAPYELKPGEKARGIVVWYVDERGNRERCETSYDPVRKRVNWKTDHLSLYMIDYEEAADFDDCLKDAACPIAPFEDARPGAWYHDGMHWAIDVDVIRGYDSGLLGPEDVTTRAQAFAMIHRLEGEPEAASASAFADVDADAWYAGPIAWAQQEGLALGYGDGAEVGPSDPLTREQLATILHRYAQWKGLDVRAVAELGSFADGSDVSAYAETAMRWAVAEGVIRGYDDGSNELGPRDIALRGQVATMLMRFASLG